MKMTKQGFLAQLRKGLAGLPQEDIEERVGFFNEMIEDRMEEGLTEEEAVAAAGSVEEIVAQTVADIPLSRIAKERIKPKRQLKTWEIVLLVLGSPIWFSLGVAVIAVVFALYVTLWSLVIALWAVFVALIVSSVALITVGTVLVCMGNFLTGVGLLSCFMICLGLAIYLCFGCSASTKGCAKLTKKIAIGIKNCFIKKEEV